MTSPRGLVLDANILIRAVLGQRVRDLLDTYADSVVFHAPETCFAEARKHIPQILIDRNIDPEAAIATFDQISHLVLSVEEALYGEFEEAARKRIAKRDPDDWPVVALSLLLRIPIWTEDRDFFGSGIATWTTDRVELFLQDRDE
jgi:predicted nucleic acid-binding protein